VVRNGILLEVDGGVAQDDLLAGRGVPPLHARWKLADLGQLGQHGKLAEEPLGHLEVEQLRDTAADAVEVVDAEREAQSGASSRTG